MPAVGEMASLLQTKLYPPPITVDFVPRQGLQARLEQITQRPLTLVSAPAGYGKSTLISAWLEHINCCGAWVALDKYDNDLASFETYFIAAIRTLLPSFGEEILDTLDGAILPSVRSFVQMLCTELDQLDSDVVLVLDDYSVIGNEDIHKLIIELLQHPHRYLHLVLVTRHDPPLPLSNWRARNSIVEIRSHELRFSLEETTRFLNQVVGEKLDNEIILALNERTEGWAAGLRLVALSCLRNGDCLEQIDELIGGNFYIAEYLASQVLNGLPSETQSFILETSILDRFCAPLCQTVVRADDPLANFQTLLQELYSANIFIIPLDNRGKWFRYHQLFQQIMQAHLANQYTTDAVAVLHSRASTWLAEHDLVEDALKHALAAGEMETAIELVAANRHELMNQERYWQLSRWLNIFPQHIIDKSPDLLLLQGRFAQILRWDRTELSQVVDRVDSLIPLMQIGSERARYLLAENDALRSVKYYFAAYPMKAFACCQSALEVLPMEWYSLRSYCWLYGAVALQMAGKLSEAYEWIVEAQREDLTVSDGPQARNIAASCFVSWITADLTSMQNVGQYMLDVVSSERRYQSHGWAHYFLACVHYHRNELERAEYHARQAFDKRYVNHALAGIFSAFILALIEQARGKPDKACEIAGMASAFAAEIRSTPFAIMAQSFQAELAVRQGRAREFKQWAEQACTHLQLSALPFFYTPQLTILKVLLTSSKADDFKQASDCLQRLRDFAECSHNDRILLEILALEALHHAAQNNESAAFAALEHSLSLAQPGGFIRLYVDLGEEMANLLRRMQKREYFPEYIPAILNAFTDNEPAISPLDPPWQLIEPMTDREAEILTLLGKRYSNKEIAAELYISPATVKRHTINIYQKLSVHKRREAVQAAKALGLIPAS